MLADAGEIRLEHLPETIRGQAQPAAPTLKPEDRVLRERLIEILRETHGNVTAVVSDRRSAPGSAA